MLLNAIEDPDKLEIARWGAISYAGHGNQMATLQLCLDPLYTSHSSSLVGVLEDTLSIEMFDHVFQLCKDHLIDDTMQSLHPRPDEIAPRFLTSRFFTAASRGELAMMEYLVSLGAKPCGMKRDDNEDGYYSPIRYAAEHGHTEAVAYLLNLDIPFGSRSLEAASKHGNPSCVKLLLGKGAKDSFKPGNAIFEALKRENELVLRILQESGMKMDESLREQLLKFAESEGLMSMTNFVECWAQW